MPPEGIELLNMLFNLTDALLTRGSSEEDVGKIWGATGFGSWTRSGVTRTRSLLSTRSPTPSNPRISTSIEGP